MRKKPITKQGEYNKELVELFYTVARDKKLLAEFLIDILTPAEFEALALRWQIVKKIHKGENHRAIAGELGLGISTVTRGSRELRNKNGGFTLALKRLGK
jgi:TrpR family trp operon transcriptional repressor